MLRRFLSDALVATIRAHFHYTQKPEGAMSGQSFSQLHHSGLICCALLTHCGQISISWLHCMNCYSLLITNLKETRLKPIRVISLSWCSSSDVCCHLVVEYGQCTSAPTLKVCFNIAKNIQTLKGYITEKSLSVEVTAEIWTIYATMLTWLTLRASAGSACA